MRKYVSSHKLSGFPSERLGGRSEHGFEFRCSLAVVRCLRCTGMYSGGSTGRKVMSEAHSFRSYKVDGSSVIALSECD